MPRIRVCLAALLLVALAVPAHAAGLADSLKTGSPNLKSAGPICFGPEGILFVADTTAAAVYAIDTGDRSPAGSGPFKVNAIDEKIASMLGSDVKRVVIADMAVNPASGRAYFSVARGKEPESPVVIVRADRDGKVDELSLRGVKCAKITLPNAPDEDAKSRRGQPLRQEAITCLAFADNRLFIAGLSNEEFSSNLRSVPFPFAGVDNGAGVEIYHGSHGQFETNSPIRTFVPWLAGSETNILAAYTCTPLVRVPVAQLQPGARVKGTTVAELGNGNRPLDMIVYQKDGAEYILLANDRRGVMKIPTSGLGAARGITSRVKDKAGVTYETIAGLKGVQHLDRLDKDHALLLVKSGAALNLESIPLP